jgi:hypothetical protein
MAQKLRQGNSWGKDWYSKQIPDFTGYSGKWAIVSEVGEAPIAQGTIDISDDLASMQTRIPPTASEILTAEATYYICQEIENLAIGFRKEFDPVKITIQKQGIPAGP